MSDGYAQSPIQIYMFGVLFTKPPNEQERIKTGRDTPRSLWRLYRAALISQSNLYVPVRTLGVICVLRISTRAHIRWCL